MPSNNHVNTKEYKLRCLISTRVIPNTPEGTVLRQIIFKSLNFENKFLAKNIADIIKHNMPELTKELEEIGY